MFVSQNFRVSKAYITNLLQDEEVTWRHLIMIDYAYHHEDANYEEGLSFFDRLYTKLGRFHPEWNIQEMKQDVEDAPNQQEMYSSIIANMLDANDIAYYGA